MVTELDTELIPEILEILEEFGKDAVFQVPATKTYDPTTGDVTEGSVTSHTKKITPPAPYKQGYVKDDLIQVGDVQVYLAASGLTFTPTNGYAVVFDSMTWRIEYANPIYTGELVALWELLLRK